MPYELAACASGERGLFQTLSIKNKSRRNINCCINSAKDSRKGAGHAQIIMSISRQKPRRMCREFFFSCCTSISKSLEFIASPEAAAALKQRRTPRQEAVHKSLQLLSDVINPSVNFPLGLPFSVLQICISTRELPTTPGVTTHTTR